MNVLITGATGFLGEPLIEALLEAGEHSLVVLSRRPAPRLTALGAQVQVLIGDINDPASLQAALAQGRCEGVYHLAGMVSRRAEDGQAMMRLHIDGTRTLLEAAHQAGVRRVVIASSSGTVAVSEEPSPIPDETWPYATRMVGNWPYYLSKIYQEKLAFELGKKRGIEVVAVNPSLLLGPGDYRLSSTGDVDKFLKREIPVVPSGGINFVDVRDAARATMQAMTRGQPGERYLLGGPNWTFAEFFGRLERASKVRGPWLRLPKRMQKVGASFMEEIYKRGGRAEPPIDRISVEMGQVYWYCHSRKAEQELGFVMRDPAETLDDTIRFLRRASG